MTQEDRCFRAHTYGSWTVQADRDASLCIAAGEGAHFVDQAGRRYLDFSSQLICLNLGYGNQAIAAAIARQAGTVPYAGPRFVTEPARMATRAVLEVMPPGLDACFFSTSGTEANEAALKLAREYMAPRYKIVTRYASYHGATGGSIALTGDYRRWPIEPVGTVPGIVHAPDAYCYRCPFHLEYPGCGMQCAEYIDYLIKREGNVAAILVEPVVGTNGVIVPPPGYLPRLREIADEHGILMITDEVMTGWHRTGEWFAVQHWDVRPDILTTAKGCTGAYVPCGVTVTSPEIREYFEQRYFAHGHTYTMHPVCLAAVSAAIDEYKRLAASGLLGAVANHLASRLHELGQAHPCVGDVRGLGHFWALELVQDRERKLPFAAPSAGPREAPRMSERLASAALQHGIHVAAWSRCLIVAPPLVASAADIDEGVQVLDRVLSIAEQGALG